MSNIPIFGDTETFIRIKAKFKARDLFFNFGTNFLQVYKLQGMRKTKVHVDDIEPNVEAVEKWIDDRF